MSKIKSIYNINIKFGWPKVKRKLEKVQIC